VQFKDGSTNLGSPVTLSGGSASLITSTLSVGTHIITAVYSGDANFNPSTGTLSPNQSVSKAGTTTTLASSQNPSTFGQTVWFTATVSALPPGSGTPTGTVQFKDGGANLGSPVALSGGNASLITSTLSVGTHIITAVYGGDANFNTSTGTLSPNQSVSKANSTTSLSSSPNPSTFGQTVWFTATVSALSPGLGTPTGTVQFKDGSTNLGSPVTLSGGSAILITSTLSAGTHTITAVYSGDANFNPSTGTLSPNQSVSTAATTTLVETSGTPSVFGQTVWFTATVSVLPPGSGTPTGTVQFKDGSTNLGSPVALSGGNAILITSTLSIGTHIITAVYSGNANFITSTGTLSPNQSVNKANSTTSLSTSPNPSTFGQTVWFTATVSALPPGSGTPTGTVRFRDGNTNMGSPVALSGGSAILITSTLSIGTHIITAVYGGDANFKTSTGTLSPDQIVDASATTTTLASSQNPSTFGQTVWFTVTVSALPPGSGTPTGMVQFKDGSTNLGSPVTLSGGGASLITSTLSVGTHTITAVYGGDANFNPSTGTLSPDQTVDASATTTTLASSQNPSNFGQTVWFTATVSALPPGSGTPTGTVQFKDGGTNLGSPVTLSGGKASISTSMLSVGTHTITAVYSGDANFNPSTGTLSPNQSVGTTGTTMTLVSSDNPSAYRQPIDFTATVVSSPPGLGTPTGTVVFLANGTQIGNPVTLVNGNATVATLALTAGTYTITATYSGDANFSSSATTLAPNQQVNKANTVTLINSNTPNPSTVGQPITVTFSVFVSTPYGGVPTGNVVVTDGTFSCSGTVAAGYCQISLMTAGNRTLTATYQGNENFNASPASGTVTQIVNKAITAATITGYTPNPALVGNSVTITYSVSVNNPGSGIPTGNVTVSDGIESCIAMVAAGECQIAFTHAGAKTLAATYGGDTNYNASPPSAGVSQTIAKRNSVTALASSDTSSVFRQKVWFTATVSASPPGFGPPTGIVQFKSDGTNLGSPVALSNGRASISTTNLPLGTHVITADYVGDENFNTSTGILSSNQVVTKANTTTTITAHMPSPSIIGAVVTVNFAVTVNAPGGGTPTGNVTVTDGTVQCTASAASGGCQMLFTSTGTKTLTASYPGDANFVASTSSPSSHIVIPVPKIFLPLLMRLPSGPRPGAWASTTNDEFNVSPNRDSIQGFAIYVDVPSCGLTHYRIMHTQTEPIVNNHFSFTGAFYADVTFDSETTAHGYDGLTNYTIPGCVTGSGGPWNFTATWQSSTPLPFLLLRLDGPAPNVAEPVSIPGKYERIILP
ncbi:MAG: Ig-like domain repeat protein, partial [Chloroflexi bacterium]|nr:Ig-like domain repeat protein [Chloroflexota bacterium]